MAIIQNPQERLARTMEKRQALLRFLRDELYTTPAVAGLVMQCGERAARQTISSMEKAGLVKRHIVQVLPDLPPFVVIGITNHGQAMAFNPAAGESVIDRTFEPHRFSLLNVQHTLDIQRLRLQSVNSGLVKSWIPSDRLLASIKGLKKPDAALMTAAGVRVAVEVERTIKSPKRYVAVLAGHLQMIQQGKWQKVIWACPNQDIADRVQALVKSITRVKVAGMDTKIDPAKHHAGLVFTTYESFTDHL